MKASRFQVHAEWLERVPGKPFAARKETTIVIPAFSFMEAMRLSEKRFPNAISRSIKNIPVKEG